MKKSILTFLVPTVAAISAFIAGLITSVVGAVVAIAVAALLIASYFIVLSFQNYANEGWIGIIAIAPGIDWGRN